MSTKFYLPSTGTPSVSPAYDTDWEISADAVRLSAVTTKIGTAMTTSTLTDTDALDLEVLKLQYVSKPLMAQTIQAQTVSISIRCSETNVNNQLTLMLNIRSWNGSTFQNVLSMAEDATEISTSLVSRYHTATSSEVTVATGDRLVFEIGVAGNPDSGMSHSASFRIGDAAATDLAAADNDSDDDNPWILFGTDTMTFQPDTGGYFLLNFI